MARARNIKPDVFKNVHLGKCSPYARLLFQALWTLADREGRLEDEPEEIKIDTLPYDDVDIDQLLGELTHPSDHKRQFISRYTVDGYRYIQIVNFKKHQKPHPNEKPSEIPAPIELMESNLITRAVPKESEALRLIPDTGMMIPDTTTTSSPGGRGCFFEIDLRGQQLTEDEWLFRCFLQQRKGANKSVMGCDNLHAMLSLYPNYQDHFRRWVTLPMARRMAAFVFTSLHSTAEDPFRYALKAAEEGQHWDKMPEYLRLAEEQVNQKDLKVTING